MSLASRIAIWILSLIIGAVFGTAGSMMHSSLSAPTVFSAAQPFPVGLAVSFIGCAALLIALRLLFESRWPMVLGGIGMYAAVLLFSQRGPGGSVVIPANALASTWVIGIAAIILVILVWPRIPAMAQRSGSQRTDA